MHFDFGMTWADLTRMLIQDRRSIVLQNGEHKPVRVVLFSPDTQRVSPWGEGPTPQEAVTAALHGYVLMGANYRRHYTA